MALEDFLFTNHDEFVWDRARVTLGYVWTPYFDQKYVANDILKIEWVLVEAKLNSNVSLVHICNSKIPEIFEIP
jgi:hypothetical protein